MDRTGSEWIGVWVGIRIGVDRSGSECGSRRERIGASLVIGAGFEWIGAGFELFRFRCGVDRSFSRERIEAGFEWLRRGVSGSELQRSWLRQGVSGSELQRAWLRRGVSGSEFQRAVRV